MKIAIIGAGVSGIVAARTLTEQLGNAADIHIFEKSRGAGGRMSTRRTDDFEFDHGAQYFTAKNSAFKKAVDTAIRQGHIAPWDGTAKYLKDGKLEDDTGGARFVSAPRMNSWIKSMAVGLNIHTETRVANLDYDFAKWSFDIDRGDHLSTEHSGFDAVICAVPAPQAQALLAPTDFSEVEAIQKVKMDVCFAVMLGFKQPLDLPWDTLRSGDGPASWIALNSAKPSRPTGATTLMVHSGPIWSNTFMNSDKQELKEEIIDAASELTGLALSEANYTTIHRWLYAAVSQGAETPCLVDSSRKILACGDWCLGGRVEGAWLSGKAAAEQVIAWSKAPL